MGEQDEKQGELGPTDGADARRVSGFAPRPSPSQSPASGVKAHDQTGVVPSTHGPYFSAPPHSRGGPLGPLDEALLATLDDAFTHHAGADGILHATELQTALGHSDRQLSERLLAVFDQDEDGAIGRAEFVDRVRRLLYGDNHEKLRFAFRIHDLDDDDRISFQEVLTMISAGLREEGRSRGAKDPETLTRLVFDRADQDGDGLISYREFAAALEKYPTVLEMIARCEACWIAPGRPLLRAPKDVSVVRRVRRLAQNRWSALTVIALWLSVNVGLALYAGSTYLGQGAPIVLARACGMCLNFNGALILLPVMRRLMTWVRRQPLLSACPVDDAVAFHRLVGHTMFGLGVVHTAAHVVNYAADAPVAGIFRGILLTVDGRSGILLLIVFAVMWVCSLSFVRRGSRFELFYLSHLLYLVWFGLCLWHADRFRYFAAVPLLGFGVERVLRKTNNSHDTFTFDVEPLTSGVTHLRMKKPEGFQHRPGDYAFLRVPSLAPHEWHPFTISSAPERPDLSMHVRSLGNFTRSLRALAENRARSSIRTPLQVEIDGPYGTPSGDIFKAKNVVLVGAGIGVTPFASVLESIVLRAAGGGDVPSKVHFYWLNRDAYSFEWFAELLMKLEEMDQQRVVDLHIYMTGGRGDVTATALNLARTIAHGLGRPDLITGLRARTNMGRPDWEEELQRIVHQHGGEPVDLFFCGPPGLAKIIQAACEENDVGFRQEHF